MWPAIVMAGFLLVTRNALQPNWFYLLLLVVSAGIIYVSLFLRVAINDSEREWYLAIVRRVTRLKTQE
jgi:hypothetical protein